MSGMPWKWATVALAVLATTHSMRADYKPAPAKVSAVVVPLEQIAATHRDAVSKVMAKPTLTTQYTEESFHSFATVYEWLLDHPDRTSLAWQRMNIPCVEIVDSGKGVFAWNDDHGSQLTWQIVSKSPGQVVWYASGKVKAMMLLPVIPVKAVVVVKYRSVATIENGVNTFTPDVTIAVQTDSRAANAIMRIAGPAMPKLAEQGAEQLLFFFSGVASYIQKHPDKLETLLGPKIAN